MDSLFAPPGGVWQPVSPRLARVRRLLLLAVALPVAGAALLGGLVAGGGPERRTLLLAALAVGLGTLVAWWLIGRTVRRWGYAELDEELYVVRGAWVRRLVVVPYGRMQYVDVQAGPVERTQGIARIQLHTASPRTTAVIPGLTQAEAVRLRDRLTALGESRAAGL